MTKDIHRWDGAVSASSRFDNTESPDPIFPQIDRTDPAFVCIVRQLARFQAAGIDIGPREVEIAITLGQHDHAERVIPERFPSAPSAHPDSVVYYARRGRLIKIGTTTRLVQRMGSLMPDELLAIEPGDKVTEYARHAQFAHLLVDREHFRDAPELRAHIEAVVQAHGEPQIAYSPLTTV